MRHKCSDKSCPICNRRYEAVDIKEETKTIDVSNGEPQHITVATKLALTLKGKHVPEKVFALGRGTYVIAEVLKNIYITNGRGKYEVIGKQHFLTADKVA